MEILINVVYNNRFGPLLHSNTMTQKPVSKTFLYGKAVCVIVFCKSFTSIYGVPSVSFS